jgi:diaminohydroxyphosphoribosylaminopyrimidine deaminase / 5-amino-6-(5-phosphoribosylamino)uracil reductase
VNEFLSSSPEANPENELDRLWMGHALEQARQGVGLASPNPTVGCVIVKDGHIVGQGFHNYDALDHAEIVALRDAGGESGGATAYVTLEPCSHRGRTGPCADALIAAGVARVVAATRDPNSEVNGTGLARMRDAGIAVCVGVMQDDARRINESFARWIRSGRPLLTMKSGVSLDGRIGPEPGTRPTGEPFWITGTESRMEAHRMRHASDAILIGINTALMDDPLLTDRSGLPRRRPLQRVVLDSFLRLTLDSRLVSTAADDLIVFCNPGAATENSAKVQALSDRGVLVVEAGEAGRVPFRDVIEYLAAARLTSLLIEGGSTVNTRVLREGLVDRVSLFYAPMLLGGQGVPLAGDIELPDMRLKQVEIRRFGEDVLVEGLIRDPWENV